MIPKRNFNQEILDNKGRDYFYGFDYDVMHPFMIRSFEVFFRKGSLLELGIYTGELTKRMKIYSEDITCVEASDIAINEAQKKLGDKISFVNGTFEAVTLPKRYDNVVMTPGQSHEVSP